MKRISKSRLERLPHDRAQDIWLKLGVVRYCNVSSRARSIVLVGMMGAGKSSVGRCLQRRIRVPLLDTDDIVASKFGMSIPEIFSRHGEEKFRQAETEALRNLPRTEQAIIVTGGGIVLRDENVDMLRELGVLIWLDGDEKALFKRASASANRPLLQGTGSRKAFARILRGRLPRYMNIAHVRIDTSMLTDEEVAVAVLSKLRRFDHNRELGSAMPATI